MAERKETKKYTFTVEGETEKWYLEWLAKQINDCESAAYKTSIIIKVQQNPSKFAKSQTTFSTPSVVHICDVESNDPEHKSRFTGVMDQIDKANRLGKKIKYSLGYSNFTFELWIALHKIDCNATLSHRSQYLAYINRAFGEHFENLDQYKKEENFKRCLSKMSLKDVTSAVAKAIRIMERNEADPGKKSVIYKRFVYYEDNPSLTTWEYIKRILDECGVICAMQ